MEKPVVKKFTAVLARLGGEPDLNGNVFSSNCEITANKNLCVMKEGGTSTKDVLGFAYVQVSGSELTALGELFINTPEEPNLYLTPYGSVSREDIETVDSVRVIRKISLHGVSVSTTHADPTVPPIRFR